MTDTKQHSTVVNIDRYRLRHLDDATFYTTLQETDGRSLVIFSSPGCASCRAWKTILLDFLQDHAGITIFEVDAHESMALVSEYEVFHMPALFLFQNGEYHSSLQCEANLRILESAIEAAFAAPAEEEP